MGNTLFIDTVLSKVNGLPLQATTLTKDQVRTLFGRWDDGLDARFAAAAQHDQVTRSSLIRQLLRYKDEMDEVYRPAKTRCLKMMRKHHATTAQASTEGERRIG